MPEQHSKALAFLIEKLVENGTSPDSEALLLVGKTVGDLYGVDADEVAILALAPKSKSLKFVMPEKLSIVGTIPLSSTSALAARTARERRPEIVNNFPAARHATVFEGVPLGRDQSELIQKIMSAPILDGSAVRGVIQISRKGRTATEAGADFTQKDLTALKQAASLLEQFLKLFKVD